MIVKTEGIILKSIKHSESNNIISVFCKETGLISGIAKGSRSKKNKSGLITEIFSIVEIKYYQKKSGDLHLISNSESISNTSKISNSYIHTNIMLMIIQSLLQSLHKEIPHKSLFQESVEIIQLLNKLVNNPFVLFICHQISLAKELGIEIDLNNFSYSFNKYNIETGTWQESLDKETKKNINLKENEIIFKMNDIDLLNNIRIILEESYNSPILSNYLYEAEEAILSSSQKLRFIDFFTRYFSFHLEKKFKYTVY